MLKCCLLFLSKKDMSLSHIYKMYANHNCHNIIKWSLWMQLSF